MGIDILTTAPVSDATTTEAGKIKTATATTTDTGTATDEAVTPDAIQDSKYNVKRLLFPLIGSTTDVAVATDIGGDWISPVTGTILQDDSDKQLLMAYNTTAGTTGTMVVDVHLNGTTIMATNKLDIETTEKSTEDAATQPDLTTTSVTKGDIFTFDIDAIHTTPAKGLKVQLSIREA